MIEILTESGYISLHSPVRPPRHAMPNFCDFTFWTLIAAPHPWAILPVHLKHSPTAPTRTPTRSHRAVTPFRLPLPMEFRVPNNIHQSHSPMPVCSHHPHPASLHRPRLLTGSVSQSCGPSHHSTTPRSSLRPVIEFIAVRAPLTWFDSRARVSHFLTCVSAWLYTRAHTFIYPSHSTDNLWFSGLHRASTRSR